MRKHLRKRPSPSMGVALIALFIALGGTTYAATGGNFILGDANTATTASSLSAPVAGGKVLQLTNTSGTAGSTALGLTVASGKTPFTVNSGTKVTNLNADKLDTLDSTAFLRTTGKAADADKLDGLDSSAFLTPSAGTTNMSVDVAGCNSGVLASYELSLSRSARIYAVGSVAAAVGFGAAGTWIPHYAVRLVDAASGVVAETGKVGVFISNDMAPGGSVSGVLLSSGTPYLAPPGNYTLELYADLFGLCAGAIQFQNIHLSNVLLSG